MQIGSLFFSVGFKSTGNAEAQKFETIQAQLADTTSKVVDVMQRMSDVLQVMSIKLGMTTEKELDLEKIQRERLETSHKQHEADRRHIQALNDQKSLYQIVFERVSDGVGRFNAMRLQVMAVATAMTYLAKKGSDYGASLLRFNQLTGLSTNSLQSLQQQAAASGLEAGQVADAVQSLQEASTKFQLGLGGDARAWSLLGLAPGQDPFAQITQLKKAAASMSAPMFTTFAKEAGFSEDFIAFIHDLKSAPAPDKNFVFSESEISALKQFDMFFNVSINKFQLAMKKLGAALVPIVTPLVESVGRWAWGITRVSQAVVDLTNNFRNMGIVLGVIGAAVAAYFFPITASITAIIILIDDLLAYFRGDNSLIGTALANMKKMFEQVGQAITSMLSDLKRDISGNELFKFFNRMLDIAAPLLTPGSAMLPAPTKPTGANFMGYTGAADNSVTHMTFNIDGAKSPKATADEIAKTIKQQNSSTLYQQPAVGY